MPRPEFQVHRLNDIGLQHAEDIAEGFSTLLDLIEAKVPASRERSLAITHLQDACFWAKRGVAIDPVNQAK